MFRQIPPIKPSFSATDFQYGVTEIGPDLLACTDGNFHSRMSSYESLLAKIGYTQRVDSLIKIANIPAPTNLYHKENSQRSVEYAMDLFDPKTSEGLSHSGFAHFNPSWRPSAMVLGTGSATEFPLQQLAEAFQVILVDMDSQANDKAIDKVKASDWQRGREDANYLTQDIRDLTDGFLTDLVEDILDECGAVNDPELWMMRARKIILRAMNTPERKIDLTGGYHVDLMISPVVISDFASLLGEVFKSEMRRIGLSAFEISQAMGEWFRHNMEPVVARVQREHLMGLKGFLDDNPYGVVSLSASLFALPYLTPHLDVNGFTFGEFPNPDAMMAYARPVSQRFSCDELVEKFDLERDDDGNILLKNQMQSTLKAGQITFESGLRPVFKDEQTAFQHRWSWHMSPSDEIEDPQLFGVIPGSGRKRYGFGLLGWHGQYNIMESVVLVGADFFKNRHSS